MLKHHVDITLTSLYSDVQALLVFKALLMAQDEVHWVLKHVDITLTSFYIYVQALQVFKALSVGHDEVH